MVSEPNKSNFLGLLIIIIIKNHLKVSHLNNLTREAGKPSLESHPVASISIFLLSLCLEDEIIALPRVDGKRVNLRYKIKGSDKKDMLSLNDQTSQNVE